MKTTRVEPDGVIQRLSCIRFLRLMLTTNRTVWLGGVTLAVLFLLIVFPPHGYGQNNDPMKRVRDAWEKRTETFHNFRIVWTEKRHLPQELRREAAKLIRSPSKSALPTGSLTDLTYEMHYDLMMVGSRMRLSEQGRLPQSNSNELGDDIKRLYVFDQKTLRWLDEPRRNCTYRQGQIQDGNMQLYSQTLQPIVFAMRPLRQGESVGVNLDRCTIDSGENIIDGEKCWVLTQMEPHDKPEVKMEFWVAPARDYVLLRYRETNLKTKLDSLLCDIYYQRRDGSGWMPSNWTRTMGHGTTMTITTANITQCSEKPIVTQSDFELQFPARTVFWDERNASHLLYVVRRDGTEKKVTNEEIAARIPLEQLIDSDKIRDDKSITKMIFIGGCALLLLILIVIFVRRRMNAGW
jgi:hypothetical protein